MLLLVKFDDQKKKKNRPFNFHLMVNYFYQRSGNGLNSTIKP